MRLEGTDAVRRLVCRGSQTSWCSLPSDLIAGSGEFATPQRGVGQRPTVFAAVVAVAVVVPTC